MVSGPCVIRSARALGLLVVGEQRHCTVVVMCLWKINRSVNRVTERPASTCEASDCGVYTMPHPKVNIPRENMHHATAGRPSAHPHWCFIAVTILTHGLYVAVSDCRRYSRKSSPMIQGIYHNPNTLIRQCAFALNKTTAKADTRSRRERSNSTCP